MAKRRRLEMWQRKEALRLALVQKRSQRQIAQSLGAKRSTIGDLLARARRAGLTWERVEKLTEEQLAQALFPPGASEDREKPPMPDFLYVYKELRRQKRTTRHLLWQEYREQHANGYGYTQFCKYYRKWAKKCSVTMRQDHKAGEKLFVDFAGDKPSYQDPKTGEKVECELFVAALGASSMVYAEAVPSQKLEHWIECHTHAVHYYGGVTEITVPDNLKQGVTKPCRYEPVLNRTYKDWAEHHDTTIIPARVGKPKDKAKVESAVYVAELWILARLRHRQFFSLEQLNRAIHAQLEELNDRPLKGLGVSRRELFMSIEKAALKPLPAQRFELTQWKDARVNIDYHIEFDRCYYSVPYALVHEKVSIRATRRTVEILFKGSRVASHGRVYGKGRRSTTLEHMPKDHRRYAEWSPSRLIKWAARTGPHTQAMVEEMLNKEKVPELAYRRCLGLLRLGRKYGADRVEAACARAKELGIRGYRCVKNMLASGFDQKPLVKETRCAQAAHRNIRGKDYFR